MKIEYKNNKLKRQFGNASEIKKAFGEMAKKISEIRGEEVTLGRFSDMSDSYHIYGQATHDFVNRFGNGLIQRHFLPDGEYDSMARTWRSDFGLVQRIFSEAQAEIVRKVAVQNEKYAQGEDLTKGSTKLFKKEGQ